MICNFEEARRRVAKLLTDVESGMIETTYLVVNIFRRSGVS